jgi:hypothetical protein
MLQSTTARTKSIQSSVSVTGCRLVTALVHDSGPRWLAPISQVNVTRLSRDSLTEESESLYHLAPSPLRQNILFSFKLNPYGNSAYVTSSLTRRRVSLLWICLVIRQMYVSHVTENSSFCIVWSPLSVQALQSRSCLSYLSYATTAA